MFCISVVTSNGSFKKREPLSGSYLPHKRTEFYKPNQTIENNLPVYIKLETEDFADVGVRGADSVWQQNMSWHPQWSRGGASGWWGVQGSEKAANGDITREIYIPESGEYLLWLRYQDYTGKAEPFSVVIDYKDGNAKAEFGKADVEKSPTKGFRWNYVWENKKVSLKKGIAKVSIRLARASEVPRDIDALILTNNAKFQPVERGFPPQAYANYLLEWAQKREPLKPLIENNPVKVSIPQAWRLPETAGRDFWYFGATNLAVGFPFPINISPEMGNPNSAQAFAKRYSADPNNAPIFGSPLNAIQIPISQIGEILKTDNSLRQFILKNKRPFVVVGNYNSAGKITDSYSQMKQIFGELWVGIISGENSYLYPPLLSENVPAGANFKDVNYQWLLGDGKTKSQQMIGADWASKIPQPFEKIIPALSVGTIPHVHQMAEAGAQTLAAESAAALPYIPVQVAFVRGAARQYRKNWTWYFGASFGSAIRTFTREDPYIIELEGLKIDSRNSVIGPSLAHIRRTLLFSYLQGASFFYPEQGYNLFDTEGKLNPMGWSYDELLRFAAKHPNRGVINTPMAILMDKAHGWDKYTYNGMRLWDKKPLERADRMIDQFFNVAYFPFPKNEGEFANDLNVPFPNVYFGDIFDVLVTSPTPPDSLSAYPAVFCLGDTRLDATWAAQLKKYVTDGGTLTINAEQIVSGLDENFLGVKLQNIQKESSGVICQRDQKKLSGTPFPYQQASATTAEVLARATNGDGIAFRNKFGKGQVILTTPSYLLGYDEVPMPYLAHLLLELTSGLEPVEVRGNSQYFVNLRPDGYVVTVSNNEGLIKLSDSPAELEMSKTTEITLRVKEKPLNTEDWLGEEKNSHSFPNEWLPEYTKPKPISWQKDGDKYKSTFKLLPGEIRVYFIQTKKL